MDNMILIAGGIAVLLLLPFVVYVSVKLGTYAFFKGRQAFKNEEINDGQE